jgi:hypothetical protein
MCGALALEHLLLRLKLEAALRARIGSDAPVAQPFLRPEE